MSLGFKKVKLYDPVVYGLKENKGVSVITPVDIPNSEKEIYGTTLPISRKIFTESSTRKKDYELTEYIITEFGVISETWHSIINIPAQVIEITEQYVKLECVFDIEKKEYGYLEFEIEDLIHLAPLTQNKLILIKIFKRPGVKTFKLQNGEHKFERNLFEKNFFQNLEVDLFSEKL